MIALELMRRGVRVQFSTYGQAADYLTQKGYDCLISTGLKLGWDHSGFSLSGTLKVMGRAPAILMKQVREEIGRIARFRPQIVISDSRITPLISSRLLEIPAAVILNQVRILLGWLGPRWLEDAGAELMAELWSAADLIVVPDLPPPWTIAEANFTGIRIGGGKLHYVGFMMPDSPDSELEPEWLAGRRRGRLIYAQISGPEPTKTSLEDLLIQSLAPLAKENTVVVSWGRSAGSTRPVDREGLIWFDWCPEKDWLMKASDVLIVRGGHSTLSQAVLCGKPMVVLPIPMQTEQEANASKMQKLGVAVTLGQSRITPENLRWAVETILAEERYRRNALRLAEVAKRYSGVGTFVRLISKRLG